MLLDFKNFFFLKVENDPNSWTCKKCGQTKKQKTGHGNTNLSNHLMSCIGPEHKELYEEHKGDKKGNLLDSHLKLMVNQADRDLFKWIEWLVMRNKSIMEVDDPLTRSLAKGTAAFNSKTVRKAILSNIV